MRDNSYHLYIQIVACSIFLFEQFFDAGCRGCALEILVSIFSFFAFTTFVTPRPGGSTHDNRRAPLNGSQFPKTQPNTCKAFDNLTCLNNWNSIRPNMTLIFFQKKYSNSRYSTEISAEFRLKFRLTPAQEKQFIQFSSQSQSKKPSSTIQPKHNITCILWPNCYVGGR